MMSTSHEFKETARSRKYFSIFDCWSTVTIIGLSMAMGIVFTLAYLVSVRFILSLFLLPSGD